MDKKKVWVSILAAVVIVLMVFVALHNAGISGFAVYTDPSNYICGKDISELSNTLTNSQDCSGGGASADTNGGKIVSSNVFLDCQNFDNYIIGDQGALSIYGIKSFALNAVIKNCKIYDFKYNLNLSSSSLIRDSNVGTNPQNSIKQIWVNSNVPATTLNTSFDESKVQVLSGGNLTVQEYFLVNVTNASGSPISNAAVTIYNESAGASVLSGTTGADGTALFNVTRRFITSATGVSFNYTVNASSGQYFGQNTSVVITNNVLTTLRVIMSDTIAPLVTIQSPNQTFTSTAVDVNLSLNEAGGACNYSIDNGATNYTTSVNSTGTGFNASFTGTDGSSPVLNAYCWDTSGNYNGTVNSSFKIAVPVVTPPGGGGGGGGSCTDSVWTCGNWGTCSSGNQTRECRSNCYTVRTERQSCSTCVNQCLSVGKTCSGNTVEECSLNSMGCYVLSRQECGNLACVNATCTVQTQLENPVVDQKGEIGVNDNGEAYHPPVSVWNPSSYIPHGDIPDAVVNTAAGTVAVAAVAGASWGIWIWLAVMFLPLFVVKLRHYSVSVFDSGNNLRLYKDGKLDRPRMYKFLQALEDRFGKMVPAEQDSEMIKFLVASGFIEVRLDEPFIITGHFSKAQDSHDFEKALKAVLSFAGASKLPVLKQVERASILGAWRAFMRERQSRHELHKLIFK